MPSMNKVMLIGRLTRDPEMRYTGGGLAVCKFSIAVDRRFKNQQGERVTDFFDCSAFRQTAEFVQQYVAKGRLVAVDGRIEINEVEQQDGTRRRYTNIICDQVETLDSPRDAVAGDDGGYGGGAQGGYGGAQGGGAQGGYGGGARGGHAPAPAGGHDDYEDEPAPAPARPARPATAAQAPAASSAPARGGSGGARRGAAPPADDGAPAPARPAARSRQPEPAYPEDDYDDSDPFADE